MKKSTIKTGQKNNLQTLIFFFLFVGFTTISNSQTYRTIDAYMDYFAKNELFVKKSLMDYSVTIVNSQLDSRTKTTAARIIEKLEKINTILINTNKGFEGNILLRDSFIKMNKKTIDCLQNGSLILDDYDYQSTLSLLEIGANFNQKETDLIAYYQELKNYENTKKMFASCYKMHFKNNKAKNILEYNAYQNILFYKMNVIDEKLTSVITAKDKKGFSDCMNLITIMNQVTITKTTEYKNMFKDNSLNDANIVYSSFIAGQKEKLNNLFNDYVNEFNALEQLKKASQPETNQSVAAYNTAVRNYNIKKNLFYAVFNETQTTKVNMYNNWLTINSDFLKNNGQFDSIYEKYAYND